MFYHVDWSAPSYIHFHAFISFKDCHDYDNNEKQFLKNKWLEITNSESEKMFHSEPVGEELVS